MITIKKYPNRRLYDTSRSTYVNLEDLAQRIREGEELRVIDTKTGADLTKEVLLQIVLEVLRGVDLLPLGMLRRIIRASGTSPVHLSLRRQLATGLELVSTQLDNMEALMPPFAVTTPPPSAAAPADPPPAEAPPEAEPPGPPGAEEADPELADLRARLAELEARLDRRSR